MFGAAILLFIYFWVVVAASCPNEVGSAALFGWVDCALRVDWFSLPLLPWTAAVLAVCVLYLWVERH